MTFDDPRWRRGVDLFNDGEFFDSHEVVEDLWHGTDGPERDFLKGFIQAAVALEHHRRGNPAGLRSVGDTAAAWLRRADPRSGGIDVAALVEDLEAFRARAGRGEDPPPPVARRLYAGTGTAGSGAPGTAATEAKETEEAT